MSVSEDFVSKYGLAPGAKSTQQEGQMHYLIAAYHQLHCLVSVLLSFRATSIILSASKFIALRDLTLELVRNP